VLAIKSLSFKSLYEFINKLFSRNIWKVGVRFLLLGTGPDQSIQSMASLLLLDCITGLNYKFLGLRSENAEESV